MKYAFAIVVLAGCSLFAQVTVTLQSGKKTQIAAPSVTSVVSLDLHVADAALDNGVITIKAIDPGDTVVIAFAPGGSQEIPVHVSPGSPVYPPGFVAPPDPQSSSASYEFRFNSDRDQFENTVDLINQHPGKSTAFHVVTATLTVGPDATTFVPSIYYRVATPKSSITLLDDTVNESPLTLQNVIVRGLHIQDDGWKFHAGYTTSADFANVFIPTEKEFAAGLDRTERIGDNFTLTPGIYFFRSIDLASGEQRSAGIASLAFGFNLFSSWQFKGEVAYGHSFAYAGEVHHDTDSTKIRARIVDKKLDFPTLRSSSLPGLSGDASLTQIFTKKLSLVSGASLSNTDLNTTEQDSESAFANLTYKFSRSWSVGSGVSYGYFRTLGVFSAKTFALPQQLNYDHPRFGAGVQYQISTASDSFSRGEGIRQTARVNVGRFQLGEFVDWEKDALSISSLFSQIPGLEQALQHLGITAVTPDQLAALLQDAAFLQLLGVSSAAQVVTVPKRIQEGGNLTWISSGAHPHQLSLSMIASHNEFATSSTNEYDLTGTYAKQIRSNNQLQVSGSAVKTNLGGLETFSPLISVSFRHFFSHTPVMAHRKNAAIGGTVFVDARRKGLYEVGMETLPGVKVILDGERMVMTDASGHFRFAGVDDGNHRVQVHFQSEREHYFTSPQDVEVVGGSVADFGIAFPKTDLWGYVKDDAGFGMENIKLQVTGAVETVIATDTSGKFVLPDVAPGTYRVAVMPESVPLGYSTENLEPAEVTMAEKTVPHVVMNIPAVRILIGTVTIYDSAAGSYVPVKDAEVSLPQIGRTVETNAEGRFTVAGLPPGDLNVKLNAGTSSSTSTVSVSVQPVTLRRDFRISSSNGEIRSTGVNGSR